MDYLIANQSRVLELFMQHVTLVAISMVIALVIAVPVGIFAARHPRWQTMVLGVWGVVYTIPSMALFALLIPWFGLGTYSAMIALIAYTQMILTRNIVVAINSINPAVVEAALGMGMSRWQVLYKIELPLALPLVVSGIRVAVVTVIGIASIAAFIDAGGLGVLIFEGIRTDNASKVIAGTAVLALFSIAADCIFRLLEMWLKLRPRT